jgi:hypothetical protein
MKGIDGPVERRDNASLCQLVPRFKQIGLGEVPTRDAGGLLGPHPLDFFLTDQTASPQIFSAHDIPGQLLQTGVQFTDPGLPAGNRRLQAWIEESHQEFTSFYHLAKLDRPLCKRATDKE